MDKAAIQRVRELLTENEKVAILTGKDQDLDSMGAALSLYLALKGRNKEVTVASPSDPLVEISSLVGIDKVVKSIGIADGDLVVSFPYKEGEVEKVSYTIEDGYLNIVVKAGDNGLSFNEADVKYKRGGTLPNLIFIVGTPRVSDLGSLFNPEALKNTTLINIDNKANNQGFGDVVLVSPKFSSVSEQVANLLISLQYNIDIDTAQNLLSGISFATDNFQKANTTPTAFEMAGFLLKKGATRQNYTSNVGRTNSSELSDEEDFMLPDTDIAEEPYQKKQEPKAATSKPNDQIKQGKTPPPDWLLPKVYRGSTSI